MNTKTSIKGQLIVLSFIICHLSFSVALTSCSDFFDQDSEHVIFTDQEHLNNATDSIYSVTGILNKLQVLADRTILLGEVRGDLIDVTDNANSDLRDLAQFNVKDDNRYNRPSDYYAVINNCNYFIAHADTALKNNRNEYIFMKEYAAVKAIRAWTYLQLVLNYGSVPFVTEPILTKQDAELNYPRYDLAAVCEYFINDLAAIPDRYHREYPGYGTIRGTDSRFFWFPITLVLGDLNLWLGSATGSVEAYRQAVLRYYQYLSERNGQNSAYPTDICLYTYTPGSTTWLSTTSWGSLSVRENYTADGELITMIPCDSIQAEGNYSQLRNLFNSTVDNDYKFSLTPSQNMFSISESQAHCCVSNSGTSVLYAPQGLSKHRSGDLRLYYFFSEGYRYDRLNNERIETQSIGKYSTRNVHIYRRQMIYFRMAEALNQIGYPRMAFQILSQGLNSEVIEDEVYPYYSQSDSLWISQLDFPRARYGLFTVEHLVANRFTGTINTMGMHSRGSGWTPLNEFYQFPDSVEQDGVNVAVPLAEQQAYVRDLLLTEDALEFAFEGVRYYDLMRFALREPNPGQFLMEKIIQRRGEDNRDAVRSEIKTDLNNPQNWYLSWKGRIGY